MINEATIAKAELPYMHRYYNIKRFYAENFNYSVNAVKRIQNTFIEALEDNQRLPRLIIVFLDRDLIDSIGKANLDDGTEIALGKLIDKILSIIDRIAEARKADMYYRKPGSVSPGEPKFIWVKMLRRHGFNKHPVLTLQKNFNEILEDALADKRHNYIMDLDEAVTSDSFDRNADLRASGLIDLWNEIDTQVQKFNRQQISLKPRQPRQIAAATVTQRNVRQPVNNNRYRP